MKKIVLITGLISGVLISIFVIVSMAVCYRSANFEGNMVLGFSAMILAFSVIFVAVKNYRDNYNGGLISFGKAFQIGLLVTLIASTMYTISWYIQYHYFMPDWFDMYTAHQLKGLKADGASAAEVAKQTKEYAQMGQSYQNPLIFIMYTYMEIAPVGIIISIISALILKRNGNRKPLQAA